MILLPAGLALARMMAGAGALWVDRGTNTSTVSGNDVLLLGTSAGSGDTGGNVACPVDFTNFATASLTCVRTYSAAAWYDDAFANASFQTAFFFDKTPAAFSISPVANWSYGRIDSTSNAPGVIVHHRKSHTLAPKAEIYYVGASEGATMTQVNAGSSAENVGPIDMEVKLTRAGNSVTVDVYYAGIHRYTHTFTNATYIPAMVLGSGCAVAHAHNFSSAMTVNMQGAGVSVTADVAPAANTDPFDTDTLSQYVAYEDAGSSWSISGGKLLGGTASQSILARGGVSFVDGEVSCVITHANDAGLALRLQDVNNYYLLVVKDESSTSGSGAGTVVIYKRVAGTYTQIGVSAGIAFTRGTSHTVTFRAVGSTLEADFDGVNKLSVIDSAITTRGLCGPRGNGSGPNTFDSLTWPDVHRYWRVHITANDGNTSFIGFTEIELRAAPAGADQTKSQSTFGAASASSAINTDNRASNVVDGSTVDGWLSSTGTFPQWWQYDCGHAGHTGGGAPNAPTIAVKQIAITGSWNAPDASPKDFTLQWSDNGSDWTTALTVAGQAGWTGASDVRVFSLPVEGGAYWNPSAKAAELTLSAADATATRSATSNGGWRSVRGLTSHSTGKWYAEVANDANGSSNGSMMFGVGNASADVNSYPGGSDDNSCGIQANNTTNLSTYRGGVQTAQGNGTNAIGVGGRAMVAYDAATGKVWLGSNGVWFGGGDPATGSNPTYTFTAGTALFLMLGEQWAPQQGTLKNNAGENAYAIPSGFAMWG